MDKKSEPNEGKCNYMLHDGFNNEGTGWVTGCRR